MDEFEWIPITSVGNWKCPYCGQAFVFTESKNQCIGIVLIADII